MKYMVYLTTHEPSGAYYIGFHSTENPDEFDGYFGSGKGIKELLKNYPRSEFKRETIKVFDDYEEAEQFESDTVAQFINDELCVNRCKNGGGIFYMATVEKEERTTYAKQRIENHPNSLPDNKGREHTGAALQNIQESVDKTHKNSRWITNGTEESKLLPDQDESHIPTGWRFGRCDAYVQALKERTSSEETKQKIKETTTGGTVWNNGVDSVRVYKGEEIPEGYIYRGFAGERAKPSNTGNKQYHDPATGKVIRLMPGDPVPEGYVAGSGQKRKTTKYSTVDGSSSIELLPGEVAPQGYYTGKELYAKRRSSYGNKSNT